MERASSPLFACPFMDHGLAGTGQPTVAVSGHWRARTALTEHRLGGDLFARQIPVRRSKTEPVIPNINVKLTLIAVQLTKKASPQGARRGCKASPMYLCSKTLFEAIGASGMNGRDYYKEDA
jgi:hypothetical protein